MSVQDFISRLRDLPTDVSSITPPSLDTQEDRDELSQALKDLEVEGSAEGRHTVLQAASLIPPDKYWENASWHWAAEDASGAEGMSVIAEWIATGLKEGIFDSGPWLKAGLREHGDGSRCKAVAVRWGLTDLDVSATFGRADEEKFLDRLLPLFNNPLSRIDVVTLIFALTVEDEYEPGTPAASTAMYRIVEHPILLPILRSLTLDTGNHLFPLTLRLLLAILPFAPTQFTPHVPVLMIITGRAVCWRDRKFADAEDSANELGVTRTHPPAPATNVEDTWKVAKSRDEPEACETILLAPARIVQFWLVAMYGAWPSNVLAFIRDPVSYLAGKQISSPYTASWETVYPDGFLAKRAGPLFKEFSLHPMLMYFTSAAELQDTKRWDKNDPSEWIARAQTIAHMELSAGGRFRLLDGFPLPEQAGAEDMGEFMLESGQATPGNEEDIGSVIGTSRGWTDVEKLQRENESLRLEARAADRVRKQYLYHIARLHSYTVRFTTEESEMNRMLSRLKDESKRYEQLQSSLETQKEQASAAQQKHTKWLAHMREKHDKLRDERRVVQEQMRDLKDQLADGERSRKRLMDELAVVKNERFKLQNQVTEVTPKVRQIEDYELRIKQLTDMQLLWDSDIERVKTAESESSELRGRLYQLEQILRAVEKEKSEQTEMIRRLRTTVALKEESRPASPHHFRPRPPDSHKLTEALDEAQQRADKVVKENTDLREELAELRDLLKKQGEGVGVSEKGWAEEERAFIWGQVN